MMMIYTFSHGTQQQAKTGRKRSSLSDAQSVVVLRKVAERSEALSSSVGARQKTL